MSYIFVGNLLTYQFFFIKQIYTAIEKKINRLKFSRKKNQIPKKLLNLRNHVVSWYFYVMIFQCTWWVVFCGEKGFYGSKSLTNREKWYSHQSHRTRELVTHFYKWPAPTPTLLVCCPLMNHFFFSVTGAWNQRRVSPVGTSSLLWWTMWAWFRWGEFQSENITKYIPMLVQSGGKKDIQLV